MSSLKVIGVTLLAAGAGAAAALLYAPDSGKLTRRRIGRALDRKRIALAQRGTESAHRASHFVDEQVDAGRRAVAEAGAQIAESLESGRRKVARLVGA